MSDAATELAGLDDTELINRVAYYHAGTGAQAELNRRLTASMEKSSARLERLTRWLLCFTVLLVVLTVALVVMTVALVNDTRDRASHTGGKTSPISTTSNSSTSSATPVSEVNRSQSVPL